MSYINQVPTYKITMWCGHVFRSTVPLVPLAHDLDQEEDQDQGTAWLYCRTCKTYGEYSASDLEVVQQPPRDSAKRRISENRLAKLNDDAVIRDRVAAAIKSTMGTVPLDVIAANLGVSPRTVDNVSADLGFVLRRTDEPDDDLMAA